MKIKNFENFFHALLLVQCSTVLLNNDDIPHQRIVRELTEGGVGGRGVGGHGGGGAWGRGWAWGRANGAI